jgi:hypothetical protein
MATKTMGRSRGASRAKAARAAQGGPKRAAQAPRRAVRRGRGRARTAALDQEKIMAAWQKAMAPADGHRRLEPLVGTWLAKTTFWMAPGAPPSTGEGVSEHRWVLGGRYLEQTYRGTSMGMPFEGRGYTGYDNVQGKYVGTWMDTMGTCIMNSVGTGKPTREQIAFSSSLFEPGTRRQVLFRSLIRIQGRDHHTFEMWTTAPAGKRFRTMLVEYRRQ